MAGTGWRVYALRRYKDDPIHAEAVNACSSPSDVHCPSCLICPFKCHVAHVCTGWHRVAPCGPDSEDLLVGHETWRAVSVAEVFVSASLGLSSSHLEDVEHSTFSKQKQDLQLKKCH